MPTPLNSKPEPKISSGQQRKNHVLRKSRSVGGDIITANNCSRNITSNLEVHDEEEDGVDGEQTELRKTAPVPSTGLLGRKSKSNASSKKGIGNIFKWFKQDRSNSFEKDIDMKNSEKKSTIRGHDLISLTTSNGLLHSSDKTKHVPPSSSNNGFLSSAESVESLCSLASTASFAYMSIGRSAAASGHKKEIPIGMSCGKATYRDRMTRHESNQQRRDDYNLSTKYQLLPADYSPPTLRRKGLENFSAISGPTLPSGPHLPSSEGVSNYTDLSDDDIGSDSTLSDVETLSMSNYSAVSPLPLRNELAPIKPKERKGEISRAITFEASIKNALEEIGNNEKDKKDNKETTPTSNNPFESDIDDDTLKHSHTIKSSISSRNESTNEGAKIDNNATSDNDNLSLDRFETSSTAPTVPMGLEPNRLEEVKIYSHIPGKRKAPEPPKRNGGAYYARIAKAMSPKSSRPIPSDIIQTNNNNVAADSDQDKTRAYPTALANVINRPKSPSIFQSKLEPISNHYEQTNIESSNNPKGHSNNLSNNQLVQKDSINEGGKNAVSNVNEDKTRVSSLKSQSPFNKSRTRGIEKSFSEKSIYAQYCISSDITINDDTSKDDEIYEFVKTKSPSPAVKSPRPWYKKPIGGIFDKSKKGNNKSPIIHSVFPSSPSSTKPENNTPKPVLPINHMEPVSTVVQTNSDSKSEVKCGLNITSSKNILPQTTNGFPFKNTKSNANDKMSNNPPRPVSLLMGISDFDRQAAEIVSQRQKQQEAKQRALNDAFYVSTELQPAGAQAGGMKNSVQKEPQEMIDEIMANVEKKMECLDEVEKHNDKWVHRMSANLDEVMIINKNSGQTPIVDTREKDPNKDIKEKLKQNKGTPSMEMKDLVSDLNSFLNTTQRELQTPKFKRKHLTDDNNDVTSLKNETENKQSKKDSAPYAKLVQLEYDSVEWACAKCTLINAKTARICTICGASKNPPILMNKPEDDVANNEMNIFEAPEIDDEKMPVKGNVLDRVVQFTALQMCSADKPQFATKVWIPTEFTSAEEKPLKIDEKALTAKISKTNTVIKDKSPKLDEVILNEKEKIKTADRSLLEKEERDAILARWKKEHDERIKAREAHFRNTKADPAPQDDVLKVQAEILMEANRKLDEKIKKEEIERLRKKQLNKSASQDESNMSSEAKITALAKMEKPVKDDVRQRTKAAAVKKLETDSSKRNGTTTKESEPRNTEDGKRLQSPTFFENKSLVQKSKLSKEEHNKDGFALKMPSQFINKSIHTTTLSPNGTLSDTLKRAMQLTSSEDSSDHEVLLSKEELRQIRLAYYEKTNIKDCKNIPSEATEIKKSSEIGATKSPVKESRVVQIERCSTEKQKEEPYYQAPKGPPRRVPMEFFLKRKLIHPEENNTSMRPQNQMEVNPSKNTTDSGRSNALQSTDNQSHHSMRTEKYEPIYCEVLPKALRNCNVAQSKTKADSEKTKDLENVSEDARNKITKFKDSMAPVQHQERIQNETKKLPMRPEQPSYTNMEDAKAIMAIEGLKLSKNVNIQRINAIPKRPVRQKIKKSVSLDVPERKGLGSSKHPPIIEERKLSIDGFVDQQERVNLRAKTVTPTQPFTMFSNQTERARTVTPQPQVRSKPYSSIRQFLMSPILDNRVSSPLQDTRTPLCSGNNKPREEKCVSKRWSNCSFPDPLLEENYPSSSNSSLSYKTAPYYAEIPELPQLSSPAPFDPKYHGWSSTGSTSNGQPDLKILIQNEANDSHKQKINTNNTPVPFKSNQTESKTSLKNTQNKENSNNNFRNSNPLQDSPPSENIEKQHATNRKVSKGDESNNAKQNNKTAESSVPVSVINNQKRTPQISRIPLPIKEKRRSSENHKPFIKDKEKNQGAIRKQRKMESPNHEKKTSIPTKMNNSNVQTNDELSAEKSNSINVASGDIIDDVLYISSPLKTPQTDLSSAQSKQTPGIVTNHEKDNLQSFQLIAPDNFMIYKALSVNYHDRIDSTKPLARKISDSSKMLDVVKKTSSLDKEHSLEEVEPSNITNGNGVFLQNESRIHHENHQRKNTGPFISDDNLRPSEKTIPNGVGDIMSRLEQAIASGNHKEAAILAKEVSKLQISTKLAQKELPKSQKPTSTKQEKINLQMFVEDKTSYNGPVSIRVSPKLTVEELKDFVYCEFEIPIGVQKWILGKSLVENEKSTLLSHGISKNGQKVFLYLVAPEGENSESATDKNQKANDNNTTAIIEASTAASGSNLPPPPDPNRKGRYWNYEMSRWSYCSSDEDEDDGDKVKGENTKDDNEDKEDKDQVKAANDTNAELHKIDAANENNKTDVIEKEGPKEDDDYEWEYFYEDVDIKGKNEKDAKNKGEGAKSPIPKRLEGLVKPSTSNQNKVGQVVNEGAVKITKDASRVNEGAVKITKDAPSPTINATPEPGPSGKSQRVNPRDGWECPTCTLLNEPKRPGCEACTTERPADYVIPPPGPADTIPRNTTTTTAAVGKAQAAGNLNTKNPTNKEAPTLKVVAATVTKTEPLAKVAGETGEKGNVDRLSNYKRLDDLDVIPNAEGFECLVCFLDIEPGDGVVLRECLHTFCKECLSGAIEFSDAPTVCCPYKDDKYSCDMKLLEREIKALVSPVVLEKHQQKSLKEVQATSKNSFHCKTPDCEGWCFMSDNINSFKCPICKRLNCITCQAIHEGQDCKQYQRAMLNESEDENSIKTKKWIEGLIATGEALNCPSCQVILLKKWGCDWVRCTYCRTEICWVTKQLRWGPNGKGDTSAGCRCMADGRTKCHPLCNYCH